MLTKQQLKLLSFVKKYQETEGVPPSYDEMKSGLGIKSKSGIHSLVNALEERGFLKRLHNRARALEILKLPPHLSNSTILMAREDAPAIKPGVTLKALLTEGDFVQIPCYGKIPGMMPIHQLLQPKEYLTVPKSLIKNFSEEKSKNYLALEITGDFLKDAGILDGDIVILEESIEFKENTICLSVVEQQDLYLKIITTRQDKIQLAAANKYMMPAVFEKSQVVPKAYLAGLLRTY